MGARIYTNRVTVGDTTIYNVTADPNGVLDAARGSIAIRSDAGEEKTYQNTDGATTWRLLGTYHLPEVIYRPEGPVDAPNVYTTAAEARAAINAGAGERALVIEVRNPAVGVTFDAGTWGDEDVVIVGRPGGRPWFPAPFQPIPDSTTQVTASLSDGAIIGARSFENIYFALDGGISTPPITITTPSVTIKMRNVSIAALNPFSPPPVPFILCQDNLTITMEATFFLLLPTIFVEQAGTNVLSLYVYSGPSAIPESFFGGDTIESDGPNAILAVSIAPEALQSSTDTSFDGIPNFVNGGGRIATYRGELFSGRQNVFVLQPGAAAVLPPIAETPEHYRLTYIRNSDVGAVATVEPDGADVLLPTDPISLNVGESCDFMIVGGSPALVGNTFFWTAIGK